MRTAREPWPATVLAMLVITAVLVLAAVVAGDDARVARASVALRAFPVCPSRDRHSFATTTVGGATALVAPGARTVLLCRYSGVGDTAGGAGSLALIAQHLLASEATHDLATKLNSLPISTGVFHCPGDGGAAIIAFFRYSSAAEAEDPVTVHLGGCSPVTNGTLTRLAGTTAPGRMLVRALTFLTRAAADEVRPYELLTHCGIEWTRIRGTFWKADHPLSDGHENPPAGWGNPYQAGTLSFTSVRTAIFTSPAGSVTFHRTTRTRASRICS